jgi:hypothetical protein
MEYTFTLGSSELTLEPDDLGALLLRLGELEAWAHATATALRSSRYEPPVPSGPEELIALRAAIELEEQRHGPDHVLERDHAFARLRFYLDAAGSPALRAR